MTTSPPPSLSHAMAQALLNQAEALEDLAAQLRPDHAATVRSVSATLRTIAAGQVPVPPAPSTGYRLIHLGDHLEDVEPVTESLLPALLHVLSAGAKVISFGMIARESGPYILADRPVGEAESRGPCSPYADRCSRWISGCCGEWMGARLNLERAEA